MKRYTLFAGVNGAGKTSLYNVAFSKNAMFGERVNLDELVKQRGDWRNETLQLDAGKEAVKLIRQYISEGVSFHQETTLAGKSIFSTIRKAKESGFEIVLYYIGVNSPDIAKDRVHSRVKKGGHGVDDMLIEKRYTKSLEHLKLILPLCDVVNIYDNSGDTMRYAMSLENGVIKDRVLDLPPWLSDVIE